MGELGHNMSDTSVPKSELALHSYVRSYSPNFVKQAGFCETVSFQELAKKHFAQPIIRRKINTPGMAPRKKSKLAEFCKAKASIPARPPPYLIKVPSLSYNMLAARLRRRNGVLAGAENKSLKEQYRVCANRLRSEKEMLEKRIKHFATEKVMLSRERAQFQKEKIEFKLKLETQPKIHHQVPKLTGKRKRPEGNDKGDFCTGMDMQIRNEIKKYGKAITKRPVSVRSSNAPRFVKKALEGASSGKEELPESLHGLEELVQVIRRDNLIKTDVLFKDIAGLQHEKKIIEQSVIYPLTHRHLFNGMCGVPKGALLFGPPGTGKTMIAKAVASESKCTFFAVQASSLGSKWHGNSEKLIRVLFEYAYWKAPSIIFIDEIDSLLTKRGENDTEITRKMKNEFLTNMDGAKSMKDKFVFILGATNKPQELDEAARRRLCKQIYIPLPDDEARRELVNLKLAFHVKNGAAHNITMDEVEQLVKMSSGFSCDDLSKLCEEAAREAINELIAEAERTNDRSLLDGGKRALEFNDFKLAFKKVRKSLEESDLGQYIEWNQKFGSVRQG